MAVHGNVTQERTDRHERVDRLVARHFADLVSGELADRDLVGIDAELFQNVTPAA